jgi:hypothetical protein
MGTIDRYEKEEYVISILEDKYNHLTFTTAYDYCEDTFTILIWIDKYGRSLFSKVEIDDWKFLTKEEIVEKVIKIIENKTVLKSDKKIYLKRCECCGVILSGLTCEYCGAEYIKID